MHLRELDATFAILILLDQTLLKLNNVLRVNHPLLRTVIVYN